MSRIVRRHFRTGLPSLIVLGLSLLSSGYTGCEKSSTEPDAPKPALEDEIPYDSLGHGTLVIERGGVLFLLDTDAKSWTAISFGSAQGRLSPSRTMLTFSGCFDCGSLGSGGYEIFLMNVDGSNLQNISKLFLYSINPHWVGDTSLLYFTYGNGVTLYQHSLVDIQSRTAIVSPSLALTVDANVSVSPSHRLAINSAGALYTMDMDGSDRVLLQAASGGSMDRLEAPAWSPDGNTIAYIHSTWGSPPPAPKRTQLIRIEANGSGSQVLASSESYLQVGFSNGASPASVCWSPDGSRIAFTMPPTGDDYTNSVYVVRSDGSGLTRVTSAQYSSDSGLQWY